MPSPDIIDVNQFQDPKLLDWPRIGAAGIVAGYVRAGEAMGLDPLCEVHCRGLASIARPRGVYWAWHPDVEPEAQAERLAAAHKRNDCELAPVADVEVYRGGFAPMQMGALLARFVTRVDALLGTGQRCAIYTADGFWSAHFPGEVGKSFRMRALWVANYGVAAPAIPFAWDEYAGWQYAANTIWSDGSFGPKPKDPTAHVVAPPGTIDGGGGLELDLSVLGNCSIKNLIDGSQPCTPLDLSDPRDRQRAMRRLGHYEGRLDGLWGPQSSAALALVQRDLGVKPTRVWDPETEAAVAHRLSAVAPTDPPTAPPSTE